MGAAELAAGGEVVEGGLLFALGGEAVFAANSFVTPTPRSEKLGEVSPYCELTCRFGTTWPRSFEVVTPRDASWAVPIAEIEIGTSCRFSLRLVAVTMMSPTPFSLALAVCGAALSAKAGAAVTSAVLASKPAASALTQLPVIKPDMMKPPQ